MHELNAYNMNNNFIRFNSEIQRKNDANIQEMLDRYKHYPLSDEFEKIIEKNGVVLTKETLTPTIVECKYAENKNNCFLDANAQEKNYFPRRKFVIKNDKIIGNSNILNSINLESNSDKASNEGEEEEEEEEEDENENENNKVTINLTNANSEKVIDMVNFGVNNLFNMEPGQLIQLFGGRELSDIKDNFLDNLITNNMNARSWSIMGIPNMFFSSFDIFTFMTENILCKNMKLDNFNIKNEYTTNIYKGGYFYSFLLKFFNNYNNVQQNNNPDEFAQNGFIQERQFNNLSNMNYPEQINYFFANGNFIHENNNLNFGFSQ